MWQLRCIATWGCHSFSALTDTPMSSLNRSTYPFLSHSVFTADNFCYAVTLTFDLLTWTFEIYWPWLVDKLRTEFQWNRTIRGGVIAISIFDLMTLKVCHMFIVAVQPGIIFTKFELGQPIRSAAELLRIWQIFAHFTWRCDLDLWPIDPERMWYMGSRVSMVCTKFERNRTIRGWDIDDFASFCMRFLSVFALYFNIDV